jgi:predicted metal-dependent hydrolase
MSDACLSLFGATLYTVSVVYVSVWVTARALRDRLWSLENFVRDHNNYQKTVRDFYEGKIQDAYRDYWETNSETRAQTLQAVTLLGEAVQVLEKKVDSLSETKDWAFFDAVHTRLNILSDSIREATLDCVRAEFATFDEVYFLVEAVEKFDDSLDRVLAVVETIQERDRVVQAKLGEFLETLQTDTPNGKSECS